MDARPMNAIKRFLHDEDGAFIVEFGIAFPVLILLSFGLLEFSLVVFDYQRAAEATRQGVRSMILNPSIPNTATLLEGSVITCTSTGGTVSCTGGSPSTSTNPEHTADYQFQRLLHDMQGIYPTLVEENIIVVYEGTNVGSPGESGGILPLVTLKLTGVRHDMIVGHLIGIPYIEFPDFKTTVLGPGNAVNVAPIKGK
jgi:hypothetical protein